MPTFGDLNQASLEQIQDTTENGGCTEETKAKRRRERNFFNELLISKFGGKPLDELVKNLSREDLILLLNNALRAYFQTMSVSNRSTNQDGEETIENLSPKRKTAECSKSHLRKIILDEANLDISGSDFSTFLVSTYFC